MKPPDLSQRQFPPAAHPLLPQFSNRKTETGTIGSSGDIFSPQRGCTVLYVLVRLQQSTTIQLMLNGASGAPLSAPYPVPAGAVLRFPGVQLANNNRLSLLFSPSVAVTYEIVWITQFFPEWIVKDALLILPNAIKSTIVETTANLGNAGVFTGQWHDTNLDGTCYVNVNLFSNVGGGIAGFVLQESDDSSDANMTRTLLSLTTIAATLNTLSSTIRCRYWRVVYTNNTTPSTTLKITADTFSVPITQQFTAGTVSSAFGMADTVYVAPRALATSIGDNLTLSGGFSAPNTGSISPFNVGASFYGGAFSGSANATRVAWTKARTSTIFRRLKTAAAGPTALWTPGTGNKFRLLAFKIQITANASLAAGAVVDIALLDAAASLNLEHSVFIPTAAGTTIAGAYETGWIDTGYFGSLSALANNVLNVTLSTALATGSVNIVAAGTEE
jgi:hypothetical protein